MVAVSAARAAGSRLPAMALGGAGLDLGGQLADAQRAAGVARLGARPRHVDLPDRADGRQHRRRGRCCGARWRASRRCAPACRARPLSALVLLVLLRGRRVEGQAEEDLTPHPVFRSPTPAHEIHPDEGPVMVTIDYVVDPDDAAAFTELMQRKPAQRGCAKARCHGACSATAPTRATRSSTSSTNRGSSTCAASTASPPPRCCCTTAGGRSTAGMRRRRCRGSSGRGCRAASSTST